MIPYIIIGLLLIMIGRMFYVIYKFSQHIKKLDKELAKVYGNYFDEHYLNCVNFSKARTMAKSFKNVIDSAIDVVTDNDVKSNLVQFSSALASEEKNLNKFEKESEEFIVRYEIEKMTKGI